MPSKASNGSCDWYSVRTLIICFAVTGVVLLVLGLVFSVGGVFSYIVNKEVDEVRS